MKTLQVEVTLDNGGGVQSVKVGGKEVKKEQGDHPGAPNWWPIHEEEGVVISIDESCY